MSFELPTRRNSVVARSRWSGTAFLVEAMLLLVFVMASVAVFTQVFAVSAERANASRSLTDAVAVATSTAESFCADPSSADGEFFEDGLRIVCRVVPEQRNDGTMYHATIDVYDADAQAAGVGGATQQEDAGDEPIYTVRTSKYESEA